MTKLLLDEIDRRIDEKIRQHEIEWLLVAAHWAPLCF